jgi:hypothetical protein
MSDRDTRWVLPSLIQYKWLGRNTVSAIALTIFPQCAETEIGLRGGMFALNGAAYVSGGLTEGVPIDAIASIQRVMYCPLALEPEPM